MRYNLKLATVMVADNYDSGLRAAFLLGEAIMAIDIETLFEESKVVMLALCASYVVTDEAPCLNKGFLAVFPSSDTASRGNTEEKIKRLRRENGRSKKMSSEEKLVAYSVISANVNVLVNNDTDEALAKLTGIDDLIDWASKIKPSSAW
ncbi:hypothetical protein GCK32_009267 [Trichostrongylus colubriformis]|uniref:Uncharacterized protein n=1 Tax=Trichostrongylus colubriformis TaxID=6319 RepID=A0AAN8FTF6_TRICO